MSFKELVFELQKDKEIPDDIKISMLENWSDVLIAKNSNCLMDKQKAEKHFQMLEDINTVIENLQTKNQ